MLRPMRNSATPPSKTPTRIEPIASQTAFPVSWWARMPQAAITMPISAERSSANTARSIGFDVTRM